MGILVVKLQIWENTLRSGKRPDPPSPSSYLQVRRREPPFFIGFPLQVRPSLWTREAGTAGAPAARNALFKGRVRPLGGVPQKGAVLRLQEPRFLTCAALPGMLCPGGGRFCRSGVCPAGGGVCPSALRRSLRPSLRGEPQLRRQAVESLSRILRRWRFSQWKWQPQIAPHIPRDSLNCKLPPPAVPLPPIQRQSARGNRPEEGEFRPERCIRRKPGRPVPPDSRALPVPARGRNAGRRVHMTPNLCRIPPGDPAQRPGEALP